MVMMMVDFCRVRWKLIYDDVYDNDDVDMKNMTMRMTMHLANVS